LTVLGVLIGIKAFSAILGAARAPATVNIADGDVAGLIAAINSANASPGSDVIDLAAGGTYVLTIPQDADNGLPAISDTLTINGNGATIERRDAVGTPHFRIFQVGGTATLNDLRITNGRHGNMGGGILNFGSLTLDRVDLSGNAAALYGGGVFSWPGSSLTVRSSTIANNTADTFNPSGCHSCSYGGGVNAWGTLAISNSTIAGNLTGFAGGGIYSNGPVLLVNSTVASNRALNNAGGFAIDSGGSMTIVNTLLSENRGSSFGPTNCSAIGPVTSLGHNLSTDGTCTGYFNQAGDLNNTPAGLDPAGLQDNGGPTPTIALIDGSAAIDAGRDSVCAVAPVNGADQRGVMRPTGPRCDIGAFEAPVVVVDEDGPVVTCASPDGQWHALDVTLTCTAVDEGSGLQNPADATFFLSTAVAAGTETADAATGSHTVCDTIGNCTTAGPINGNKVDKKAPTVSLTSPTATTYLLNQSVNAAFGCADGGSGVATCVGTVATGTAITTGSVGSQTFVVTATDEAGNTSTQSVTFTVAYNQCLLFDPSKSHRAGSTIPIKLTLCDASGANVSSSSVALVATAVFLISNNAPGPLADSGNANPDLQFRFSDGAYIFNLSLKNFSTGTYALTYTAGSDPTTHVVQFQVK